MDSSEDDVFFMNDAKFDYKLLQEQMRMQTPVEYKGVNYIIQAQNLDKEIARQLIAKREEYNWGELEDQPLTWTTEDFKRVALGINASVIGDIIE